MKLPYYSKNKLALVSLIIGLMFVTSACSSAPRRDPSEEERQTEAALLRARHEHMLYRAEFEHGRHH